MRKTTILFKFILLTILKANACTCLELTKLTRQEYDEAGDIFIGRVISIKEFRDDWYREVTFEVIKQLKSEKTKSEITIITPIGGAACGLDIAIGDKWYIFSDPEMRADLCGRNVHLNKKFKFKEEIRRLPPYLLKREWRREMKRYRIEKKFIENLSNSK